MKTILKLFLISLFFIVIIIFSSCSEDELPVTNTETNPPSETLNGAFILCQGTEVYPQERYIGFYNIDKDDFNYNIFKPGIFPQYPRSIVYSNGNLFVSTSYFYSTVSSKIYKISAWGSSQGEVVSEVNKTSKPNLLFKFNDQLLLTYYITNITNPGSFEVFQNDPLGDVTSYHNIGKYISSFYYLNNKVFLTTSSQQGNYKDSSIIMFTPPDSATVRTVLRGNPSGIALINGNKLIVGCSGTNSLFYYINPDNLEKTDSVECLNGFARDIITDRNMIYSYFISMDDKIIKFNPALKTFYPFITNAFASDNYVISGYNIDPNTGKHYVLFSSRGDYYGGKMQIYSNNGYLEKTIAVGKKPIQVIFAKEN